jgi:hypothetical protein
MAPRTGEAKSTATNTKRDGYISRDQKRGKACGNIKETGSARSYSKADALAQKAWKTTYENRHNGKGK